MTNTTKVPSTNEAYVTKRGSCAPNKKAAHGPPMIWWAIGGLGSGRGGGFDPPFLQFASPKAGFSQKRTPDVRVITFSSYYLLIFSKYAKTPHKSAVFLLCISFVNTSWNGRLKSIFLNIEKNAARRAAHQLRAQRSGSQLERRSKGAGG